jgi:hypothetical protein
VDLLPKITSYQACRAVLLGFLAGGK